MFKSDNKNDAYKTIGEGAKEVSLIDKNKGNLQTHTLRYWEKEFRQIKPSIKAGKRRYYSNKDIKIIKFVKYLLKDKGLTIKGVKKILNNPKIETIDDNVNLGIYKNNFDTNKDIKDRLKKISKIIKDIKNLKNG